MISYRSDIDGLRALSIVPVLLFHAGYSFMPGGFVGVDTFFVISGFLITSMISKEVQAGHFSFGRFYMRRARRLLPALICVYAAVIAFSWLYDTEQNFRSAVEQVFSSIFYVSNIYYLFHIDYFAGDSFSFILLHTWSLSIEEQFYLIFPVAIWLAFKASANHARLVLTLATAGSLAFSAYLSLSDAHDGEYYNSLSRFWELGAGGCAALYGVQIRRFVTPIRAVSLLTIIAAPFLIQPHHAFPFPTAIPSVLATLLLIVARGEGKDPVSIGLGQKAIVYIGKISYSLYIWHWVIFVMASKLGYFNPGTIPLVILATVLVSIASYHLIEQPFRYARSGPLSHKAVLGYFALALSLFATAPVVYAATQEHRLLMQASHTYQRIMAFGTSGFRESGELDTSYRGGECFLEPSTAQTFKEDCYTVVKGRPNIALMGDSNAAHYQAGIRAAFPNAHILQLTGSNCMLTVPGVVTHPMDACKESNRLFFEKILPSDDIDLYIFAARWPEGFVKNGTFEKFLASLAERGLTGKSIIVGRQTYFSQPVTSQAIYKLRNMDPEDWDPLELNRQINEVVKAAEEMDELDQALAELCRKYGVAYVSALELQQHPDGIEFVSPDRELLYWDTGHLTTEGARHRVSQMLLLPQVQDVLEHVEVGTVRP